MDFERFSVLDSEAGELQSSSLHSKPEPLSRGHLIFACSMTPPPSWRRAADHRSRLLGKDLQDAHEQVDDVEVQSRGTINCIVEGALDLVGTAPVDADVTAEDRSHDPIHQGDIDFEKVDLDKLNDDRDEERGKQCALNALEEGREQGAQDHHARGQNGRDADCCDDVFVGVPRDEHHEHQADWHDDQVVPKEAERRLFRAKNDENASEGASEVADDEYKWVDCIHRFGWHRFYKPPVEAEAP